MSIIYLHLYYKAIQNNCCVWSLLQFRYKSKVYKQPNVDEKQIAKLHTKVS